MTTSTPPLKNSYLSNDDKIVIKGDLNLRESLKHKFLDDNKLKEVLRFVTEVRQTLIEQISKDFKISMAYYYPIYKILNKMDGFELHVIVPRKTAILFIKEQI